MANLVMYCGIMAGVRKALGATFVCTTMNTTAENTGYTNDTHAIRTIEAHLCHLVYIFRTYIIVKIRSLSELRGDVSTVGKHSCTNGHRHTDTQTDKRRLD